MKHIQAMCRSSKKYLTLTKEKLNKKIKKSTFVSESCENPVFIILNSEVEKDELNFNQTKG